MPYRGFAARGRGRPQRLPDDPAPTAGMFVDSRPRLSWLLATLRLHAAEDLAPRKAFAQALTRVGVNADPSRISRWESGTQALPDRVLFGYETVLGLTPGQLTCHADELRACLDPDTERGHLLLTEVPTEPEELDALFAHIDSPARTPTDWITLAEVLHRGPYAYLPTTMWAELADRLLFERVLSHGTDSLFLSAACRALAQDPTSQRFVVKAIGRLVTHPGAPFVEPALRPLRHLHDPKATRLVLRMLHHPSATLRRGAARVTSWMIARGQLDDPTLDTLQTDLPHLLDPAHNGSVNTDALDILAALPEPRRTHVLTTLDPTLDPTTTTDLRHALDSGQLLTPEQAHRTLTTISTTLGLGPPTLLTEHNPLLLRLLHEALTHIHHERRHQAGLLLAATPYAHTLPHALLRTLDTNDPTHAARTLELLTHLPPDPTTTNHLLELTHHPNRTLRLASLTALTAHTNHSETDPTALEHAATHTLTHDHDPHIRIAALNLLGLTTSPHLARHTHDPDQHVSATALWWTTTHTTQQHIPPQRTPTD